jgi:hypothetical protein
MKLDLPLYIVGVICLIIAMNAASHTYHDNCYDCYRFNLIMTALGIVFTGLAYFLKSRKA